MEQDVHLGTPLSIKSAFRFPLQHALARREVLIGAALMRVLRNTITLVDWIPTHIEYAVIGIVILGGVTVDELLKRVAAKRRAAAEAKRGA